MWHGEDAEEGTGGGETLVGGLAGDAEFRPSIYKVVRQLKREDHGCYNCLRSIDADADAVRRVRAAFRGLPMLANLRCGLWYVDAADGTCYFKSTDGHAHNWKFSTQRLNLHVARLVAERGGVLVVDATRSSTKRVPDSFAKTVPIWAAVLNRAVSRLRAGGAPDGWDEDVHLPPWVTDEERAEVDARLEGFVDSLLGVAPPGLEQLVGELRKPLRCLWVSAPTASWGERGAPSPDELPFAPVVLVSASQAMHWRGERRSASDGAGDFAYIPGAADDEESWAHGLTPELFFEHRAALLASGTGGCEALCRTIAAGGGAPPPRAQRDVDRTAPPLFKAEGTAAELGAVDDSVHAVGDSGLLLGTSVAAASAAAREASDACVHCAGAPAPGLAERFGADRLLSLDVQDSKYDRHALERALPDALAFAAPRLARGERVLLACADGRNRCVAVAVALLVCLYADGGLALAPAGAPPRPVAKDDTRKRLALLAEHYPAACPTRGMLKQVYAFCRERWLAGRAPDEA